ncbi:MAG: Threonylcarbamoyl-AMP synthase [Firmicutes bacterium ADurb.Bin182]|nr:MAG: Threonylcarbamoyl-AMP synthase [Firmicutes bacterium ADurb.Bin182]
MKTEVYSAVSQKENGTRLGADLIRRGQIVAFPTETVYGLGANGLDPGAVGRIFEAKGRPNDNPLILHVARKSDVKALWTSIPPVARQLMDVFWPGPLTLVYFKSDIVPDEVTAGLPTVAVRCPRHKTALALIRAAGLPVAAPSANASGKPSPTTAQHVLEDMDGKIPLILDGGPCKIGVESTVLSLTGTPRILRPGGVTKEMIEAVIGEVQLSSAVLAKLDQSEKVESPGMKYRHYAPDAEVIVVKGEARAVANRIKSEYEHYESCGFSCTILATEQTKTFYHGKNYVIIGDRDEPETLCARLFSCLRRLSGSTDVILAEEQPAVGAGMAFMNRLLHAAGFKTLQA